MKLASRERLLGFCLIAGTVPVSAFAGQSPTESVIIHRGFDDFRAGAMGDGGANTYVSKAGNFQTIGRWDFNRDGEIDFLFTQDHNHDYAPDALIYWGGPDGPTSLAPELAAYRSPYSRIKHLAAALERTTWLPSLGGGRCAIADLNVDGFPDIVFANTMHNFRQDMPVYVYWGSAHGFRGSDRTVLPAFTATGLEVADLNEDGLPDIVVANQGFEAAFEARFGKMTNNLESYIYWGSPLGYDASRSTSLATVSAADVAVGDFNGDRHPDVAFANGPGSEAAVVIYHGNGRGAFDAAGRRVLDLAETSLAGNVAAIVAAEVNGDGYCDLAVGGQHECAIYRGSAAGLGERITSLPAESASELALGDFNRDGFRDIVVANAGANPNVPPSSVVYWGVAEGWDARRRTSLPTQSARSVAVGDINGDGFPDLLFGNRNDNRETPAQIFLGGVDGFVPERRKELQAFGGVGAAVADLDGDGHADVLLCNHLSGTESLPTSIFWGNPRHDYSSTDMTTLEPGGTMMSKVADLDDDGFPDLLLVNEGVPTVWWGSEQGYSARHRTPLPTGSEPAGKSVLALAVADLDRDGYLDVAAVGHEAYVENGKGPRLFIVHGDGRRFASAHVSSFPVSGPAKTVGAIAMTVADLDRDGYLELIVPLLDIGIAEIWWGGAGGYSPARVDRCETNGASAALVADLDGDGWLEVVFTSGLRGRVRPGQVVVGGTGIEGSTRNSESIIHWGGPRGFQGETRLETYNALDGTVADLNRDGHLDIAFTNYLSDTTRELPAIIYWGDGTRRGFGNDRRAFLDAASSAGIDALDLDRDGWLELVVTNHQKHFSHGSGTYIYWGGPQGYSIARRSTMPSIGAHLDTMVDAGNIYSRRYEWELVSKPVEAPGHARFAGIGWKAEALPGTGVKFQIRTTQAEADLSTQPWSGPSGADSFYETSGQAIAGGTSANRWLQYRAILFSVDGANSARLQEVTLHLADTRPANPR